MNKVGGAIHEIHTMDTLASRDRWMNNIHPLVKLLITVGYIAAVVSFQKYDVAGLAGMVVYPIAGFMLSELSFRDCLRRLRLVLPLVCLLGIFNPFLDKNYVSVAGLQMSAGVLSMLTLIMKGLFSVLASYILIATTSIDKLCYALRLLRIPKPVVTQFMLTYRYITVLLEEVNRITQAYELRAPGQKGIHFKVWGSLTGQLLLRSVDRAGSVYESMLLRGYRNDYRYMSSRITLRPRDIGFLLLWGAVIALFRIYPVMLIIGSLIGVVLG